MDENTWRFAQLVIWLIGIQTAFLSAVIAFVWNNLSKKIDKIESRIDRVEEKINHSDSRLAIIETMLHLKDCCLLKDNTQLKKVE